ncbi:EAL domain-containing protein [Paenibacillus thailandensis]|jgi:EAL domain-containing protein (putative c-di-GMP-specific phosphodiesterase class I)|uniref:EAL domain-containing protein n=1 Tax=Paenibacillus thailandensis TaxID=393250 RepID=A0ABW5R0H7_9BACL
MELEAEGSFYHSLKQAIYDNRLELRFKPAFRAADGELAAVEAAMVWRNPEGGEMPMDEYRPLAERTGLLIPLTERFIQGACRKLRNYQQYVDLRLKLVLKLTARQLDCGQLADYILYICAENKLSPSTLVFELQADDFPVSRQAVLGITKLRAAGAGLMYHGMPGDRLQMQLWQLPFTSFKLPKELASSMLGCSKERLIAASFIEEAHQLDMDVTADGVMFREQAELFRYFGCDCIQGYLFGQAEAPHIMDLSALPLYSDLEPQIEARNVVPV